jgi:hypothetical protein
MVVSGRVAKTRKSFRWNQAARAVDWREQSLADADSDEGASTARNTAPGSLLSADTSFRVIDGRPRRVVRPENPSAQCVPQQPLP